MGTVRVSGVKKFGGLSAEAFTPLQAGGEAAFYYNDTRHRSLVDEVWHPIHAIKVAEGVSGTVRVAFMFQNNAYDDFETSFARVRVNEAIYTQKAANNRSTPYQQDVGVQGGDIIYIDVYCDGYGSSTLVDYIRLCLVLPFTLFERVYLD